MVLPPRQFQFSHTLAVPLRPLGLGRKSQVDLERGRNSLPERLHEASEPHLLYLHGPKNGPVTAATVYLSTLQRMCLHDLRAELVDVVSQIFREKRATKQMMDDARDLLQKFTSCLRDYDYMTEQEAEARRNDQPDPFNISTQMELGQYLLRPLIDQQLADQNLTQRLRPPLDQGEVQRGNNVLPPGVARGAANDAARLRLLITSLVTGIIAGLALILPMLIMVLVGGLAITLIISSAAAILFAGGLAFFTDMQPESVMGAVAAYAAVYVVFVGASL